MKLILIRHGETVENAAKIIQGHLPGNLNEKGKLQAKKVAEKLKNEKIDVIFSSDLKRTKQTTDEIMKYHKVPVHFLKEVREMHRGTFDGQVKSDEYEKYRHNIFQDHSLKYPGGESVNDVRKRVSDFLEMLHQNYSKKTVLLVSHGAFLKILIYYLEGKIGDLENYDLENSSVSIIEFDEDKKHKFHLINDIAHLI